MGNCLDKLEDESKYLADEKPSLDGRPIEYRFQSEPNNQNNRKSRSHPSTPHLCKSEMSISNNCDKRDSIISVSGKCSGEISGEVVNSTNKPDDSPGKRSEMLHIANQALEFGRSRYLVALFDYSARTAGEVSMKKGEKFVLLKSSDAEWWHVEDADTGRVGYVPSAFLAPEYSYEAQDWFFRGISRKDAERYLLQPLNTKGCFLVRESETTQGALCLSVLDQPGSSSNNQLGFVVNHYKIKRRTNSTAVYISAKQVLPNLNLLIHFYSSGTANRGLCCPLSTPCPRPRPTINDLSFQTRDHWEIDRLSLLLSERLGAGQFGEVWKATWNDTTFVAVKTLKPGSTTTREEFLKEARIMKALSHPNLVRLLAICSDEPIYIVTEFMGKGSLLHYLRSDTGQSLVMKQLLDFISQIANGMAFLEVRGYVHRDLAARNILVGESDICKVADFGLARIVDSRCQTYEASQGSRFPVKWTAPEAALWGKFSVKSDVWSFGVLVYEVITKGQVPFPSMSNTEALERVQAGYRMPRPMSCPQPVYDVSLHCWDIRAENRPTFASLRDVFDDLFVSAESGYRAAECISR